MSEMKPILGWPNYFADKLGNIFSSKSGVIKKMKPRQLSSGYLGIKLEGKKDMLVHRLILMAHIGEPNGLHCNHKNGIRNDNRLENLEWVTRSQNEQHAIKFLGKKLYGHHQPGSKLKPENIPEIMRMHKEGITLTKIGEKFGVYFSTIDKVLKGQTWKHIGR